MNHVLDPRGARAAAALLVSLAICACGSQRSDAPASVPAESASPTAPLQPTFDEHGHPVGIHNFHKWSDRIGAGAQPEGEEAFRNLAALGYRVLVSVDGARPDIELAAKYGLRYVHAPFGYDGVPEERRLEIAKTALTAEGPVFIH